MKKNHKLNDINISRQICGRSKTYLCDQTKNETGEKNIANNESVLTDCPNDIEICWNLLFVYCYLS